MIQTRKKKKSNTTLWIMLLLIVVVCICLWYVDKLETAETPEPAPTEQAAPTETDEQERLEAERTTLAKVGDEAPDFTVEMLDGSRITLSKLRGKVVLLNFWATWCPPCRQELSCVQKELIDRFAGEAFVFLPLSRGEKREVVAAFLHEKGYAFPAGLDPDASIYGRYAERFIPRNFLIDPSGRIVAATTGYEPEEFGKLVERIRTILAER